MFGSTHSGASAYAKVGVETSIANASPHKLITMLFEGALIAVSTAMYCMKSNDVGGKAQSISKAILIIDNGLRASLDKKVGGPIAENLDALYAYLSNRLILANVKNQLEILEEVHGLLIDLKSAWDAIGAVPAVATAQPMVPFKLAEYDALAPRISNLVKA